jgi:hypothetical protein
LYGISHIAAGSIVTLRPNATMGMRFNLECGSRMPVDIAKAYFEILQLRKEIRKAERAFRISLPRPPSRPRHSGRTGERGSQAINPQMPLLKRGLN